MLKMIMTIMFMAATSLHTSGVAIMSPEAAHTAVGKYESAVGTYESALVGLTDASPLIRNVESQKAHPVRSIAGEDGNPNVAQTHATSRLSLIENKGQIRDQYGNRRPDVLFLVHTETVQMFIMRTGISYTFSRLTSNVDDDDTGYVVSTHRLDMTLLGANPHSTVASSEPTGTYFNYYLEKLGDPVLDVKGYGRIRIQNVYPKIDMEVYVNDQGVKYDFIVHPGGNPALIRMKYTGGRPIVDASSGVLHVDTPYGVHQEASPISFQDAGMREIPSDFTLDGDVVSFQVATYDPDKPLIIDPAIIWGTYYGGGGGMDYCYDVVTLPDRSVVITGRTNSNTGIATTGSFQATFAGDADAYIARFDSSGHLMWGTYVGGVSADVGRGLAFGPSGDVFVLGHSDNSNVFATPGAHQTAHGGATDCFLMRMTTAGYRVWGTYYGGTNTEEGPLWGGIDINSNGDVYIIGRTESNNGIVTSGVHQTTHGGNYDSFLAKFSAAGTLLWGTYYGGAGSDVGYGIDLDALGDPYVVGMTESTGGIASAGAVQTTYGGARDGYVAKFSSNGARLWGSYYGGTGQDELYGACAFHVDSVVVVGHTMSSGLSTPGAYKTTHAGVYDGILVSLSGTGVRRWATYYGGGSMDHTLAIDYVTNDLCIVGTSQSTSAIALPGAHQGTLAGADDVMLLQLSTSGVPRWCSYYGGTGVDGAVALAHDLDGNVVFVGATASSTGIAFGNRHQSTLAGAQNALVTKMTFYTPPVLAITTNTLSSSVYCADEQILIPYTASGTYQGGNVFTAQLSDSLGSFASPTAIGTFNGTVSGSIQATIPTNISAGTGYRVRVTSSLPPVIGSNNGSNITLAPLPTASITPGGPMTICSGDSVLLAASTGSGYTYTWKNGGVVIPGATSANFIARSGGSYTVDATVAGRCTQSSAPVIVQTYPSDPTFLTWTGAVNTTWTTIGNWDNPCAIPSTGDTVLIPSPMLPPASIPAISLSRLVIDNAISVPLAGDLIITGSLALVRGRLVLHSNNVTIVPAASITQADSAGYIVTNGTGELRQGGIGAGGWTGSILFPLGRTTSSYTPVVLTNTGSIDEFRMRVTDSVLTGGTSGTLIAANVVGKTWHVSEQTAGGSNAILSFQWNAPDEAFPFDRTMCAISRHTGTSWLALQADGAATGTNPYERVVNAVTAFSQFAIRAVPPTTVQSTITSKLGYCPGEAGSVAYVASSRFSTGNTLSVELSNVSGSFATATVIGTLATTDSAGSIPITIPLLAGEGTGYRMRIRSSAPTVTGPDNGTDIRIYGSNPTSLVWTGALSTAWGTLGNWDNPCAIPTTGDTVLIPPATVPPAAIPALSLSRVVVNNVLGANLGGDLIITGSLALQNGRIRLNTNNLTITPTATITQYYDSAFVVTNGTGELRQGGIGSTGRTGIVTFPVGRTPGSYTPVEIQNAGVTDEYRVRVTDSVLTAGTTGVLVPTHVVGKTWHIHEEVPGGSTASLTLSWNAADELPLFSRTQAAIAKHTGTQWLPLQANGPAFGSGPHGRTILNLTSFSPFAVGDQSSIIPVELQAFTAREHAGGILVEWTTASEQGSRGFQLQRQHAEGWQDLAFLPSVGAQGGRYQHMDHDCNSRTCAYRLLQIDFDGTVSMSPVITVDRATPMRFELAQNAPNPFTQSTTIEYTLEDDAHVSLRVMDLHGRVIEHLVDEEQPAGRHLAFFDAGTLPNGVYLYQLLTSHGILSRRMIIAR